MTKHRLPVGRGLQSPRNLCILRFTAPGGTRHQHMRQIYVAIRRFLYDRFSLQDDKADEKEIVESIRKGIEFKGTNLWTLIFAIFIASIGLNVNSTAVIIGAMLISPIMGPIMGIGLGIGISDFGLIRRASKNLAIAAFISICVSTFYFWVTPLHNAQSELLSRTTPSIWDVFIAFFGGLAGIVAGTRREKSNVIPGVAIATALMPPLCTAGFGLATGHFYFFLGAIYLFFINSIFICLATFIIVRYLHFRKTQFETPELKKRMTRYIWIVVIVTALPSIYLAYRIVRKSIFESNAEAFVRSEVNFPNTFVVNKTFKTDDGNRAIDLLLIGEELSATAIDSLKQKMPAYHLEDAKLEVHQGLNARQKIDFAAVKASIVADVMRKQQELDTTGANVGKKGAAQKAGALPEIKSELKALYPQLKEYGLSISVIRKMDTAAADTSVLFIGTFRPRLSGREVAKLRDFLQSRTKKKNVKVMQE